MFSPLGFLSATIFSFGLGSYSHIEGSGFILDRCCVSETPSAAIITAMDRIHEYIWAVQPGHDITDAVADFPLMFTMSTHCTQQ